MTTETAAPEPWSAAWLAPFVTGWEAVAQASGPCGGKGIKSQWWPDQVLAVGPALLAEAYKMLIFLTPECREFVRTLDRPATARSTSAESGTVEQLGLPI